jgi:predicted glycoside hydrolase/deacetylase ChbG (UPF0249 family)
MRFLIVNADDFGMTEGINAGIAEAHRRGIVTSASLMVRQPEAVPAAALAREMPRLGVGLHIDLTEWEPVDGETKLMYARANLDDASDVAREIAAQLALFEELVGRPPDHLDSHQHVHFEGPARAESIRLARELGVPLRAMDTRVKFCGDFYGQKGENLPNPEGISATNLLRLVREESSEWLEVMCHPGYARGLRSIYAAERERELAVLTDPSTRSALESLGVQLRSFSDGDA